MRNLFIILVLSNLALFAWQKYWPSSAANEVQNLPRGIQVIEMLEEAALISESETVPESPLIASPQCYTIGPFRNKEVGMQVKNSLQADVGEIAWRSKQENRHHRYWVYMSPLSSRSDAIAMSKSLARKKVKDYYIVNGGKNKNAISLGHFKEKQHAGRRLKHLKKLGFSATIEPIYREYKLYWLDYKDLKGGIWQGVLPEGVGRLKRDCI